VRIEAGGMERIDTAALQLIAAFVRDMRAASRTVEWGARSEALDQAIHALGLEAALGLAPAHT
jgi:ABC-type transporter Mla MlaB component